MLDYIVSCLEYPLIHPMVLIIYAKTKGKFGNSWIKNNLLALNIFYGQDKIIWPFKNSL